jgi:hypothetical protein
MTDTVRSGAVKRSGKGAATLLQIQTIKVAMGINKHQ